MRLRRHLDDLDDYDDADDANSSEETGTTWNETMSMIDLTV